MLEIANLFEVLTKQSGIAGDPLLEPVEILMQPNPADPANEIRFSAGPINTDISKYVGGQTNPDGTPVFKDVNELVIEGIHQIMSLMQLDPGQPFGTAVLDQNPKVGEAIFAIYPQNYDLETWKRTQEEQLKANVQKQRTKRRIVSPKINEPPPAPPTEEEKSKPKRKSRKKNEDKEEISSAPSTPSLLGPSEDAVSQTDVEKSLEHGLREEPETKQEEVLKKEEPKPPEIESSNTYNSTDQYVEVFDSAIQNGWVSPGSMVHGDKIISAAIELATARAMSGGPELEGAEIISVIIGNDVYHYQWTETAAPASLFGKEEHIPDVYFSYEHLPKPYTIRFPVRSAAQKKMATTPDKWVNTYRDEILQMKRAEIPVVQKSDDTSIFMLIYRGDELWYKLKNNGFYKRVSHESIIASREELNMFSNMVGTDMFEGDNKIVPGIKTSSYIRKLTKIANKFSLPKLLED